MNKSYTLTVKSLTNEGWSRAFIFDDFDPLAFYSFDEFEEIDWKRVNHLKWETNHAAYNKIIQLEKSGELPDDYLRINSVFAWQLTDK